jgi:hypothetical protein
VRIEGAEWVEEKGALVVDFISETAVSRASLWTSARKMEARRAKSVVTVAREMPEAARVMAMILPARDAIVRDWGL